MTREEAGPGSHRHGEPRKSNNRGEMQWLFLNFKVLLLKL